MGRNPKGNVSSNHWFSGAKMFREGLTVEPLYIFVEFYIYPIPRKSKDQTLPIGSRESFIWIILKTILCLVLDFQGIYIYIAGRDGFPAPASQLLGTSASDPLRETVASPDMAQQGSQGEENATKNFPPQKKGPFLHESLIFMVNPW